MDILWDLTREIHEEECAPFVHLEIFIYYILKFYLHKFDFANYFLASIFTNLSIQIHFILVSPINQCKMDYHAGLD